MNISDILKATDVLILDKTSSKIEVLQVLTEHAAKTSKVDARSLLDVVLERENLGNTAFGKGVALPHGRIPALKQTQALFAKINGGVDFDAVDGKKVDLVFMLLSPENSGADHLTALSAISGIVKNDAACAKLRKATNPTDIYKILVK